MKIEKGQSLKIGASILLIAVILLSAQVAGTHLSHAIERGGFHYSQFALFAAASTIALALFVAVLFNAVPATGLFTTVIGIVLLFLWLLPRIMSGGPPGS